LFDHAAFGLLVRKGRRNRGLTQHRLAELVYGDIGRKGDISRIENGKTRPNEATVKALIDELELREEDVDACYLGSAETRARTEAELDAMRAENGTLAAKLKHLENSTRWQLEALASRFEIESAHGLPDAALYEALVKRSEDYAERKQRSRALPDTTPQLRALKDEAERASDDLDFARADRLLFRAAEIEREIADEALKRVEAARETAMEALNVLAATEERRADNALLRGRAEEAFRVLSSAADSFASLDLLEPARRRLGYAKKLGRHGMRYGGTGLGLAAEIARSGLRTVTAESAPFLWGGLKNNLAIALQKEAARTGGAEGARIGPPGAVPEQHEERGPGPGPVLHREKRLPQLRHILRRPDDYT